MSSSIFPRFQLACRWSPQRVYLILVGAPRSPTPGSRRFLGSYLVGSSNSVDGSARSATADATSECQVRYCTPQRRYLPSQATSAPETRSDSLVTAEGCPEKCGEILRHGKRMSLACHGRIQRSNSARLRVVLVLYPLTLRLHASPAQLSAVLLGAIKAPNSQQDAGVAAGRDAQADSQHQPTWVSQYPRVMAALHPNLCSHGQVNHRV